MYILKCEVEYWIFFLFLFIIYLSLFLDKKGMQKLNMIFGFTHYFLGFFYLLQWFCSLISDISNTFQGILSFFNHCSVLNSNCGHAVKQKLLSCMFCRYTRDRGAVAQRNWCNCTHCFEGLFKVLIIKFKAWSMLQILLTPHHFDF